MDPPILEAIEKKVDLLLQSVLGNGQPGLRTDVAVLKERVGQLEESKGRWRDMLPGVVGGVLVALIVAGLMALVAYGTGG